MRNRLVHEYWAIDLDEVWDIATKDSAVLISQLAALGVTVEKESSSAQ